MTTIQLNFFKLNFFSLEPVEKHEAENNYEAILGDRITMNSTRRTPRSKHLNKYIIFLCLYNIFSVNSRNVNLICFLFQFSVSSQWFNSSKLGVQAQ